MCKLTMNYHGELNNTKKSYAPCWVTLLSKPHTFCAHQYVQTNVFLPVLIIFFSYSFMSIK